MEKVSIEGPESVSLTIGGDPRSKYSGGNEKAKRVAEGRVTTPSACEHGPSMETT